MYRYMLFLLVFMLFTGIIRAQNNHLDIITSMQGDHNDSYFGNTMATLDFNHDGYDDLIVCSPEWKSVYPDPVNWPKGRVDIYFGGPGFDNIPDITMEGQYDFQYKSVVNIGDISGDGFDDLYIGGDEPAGNPGTYYLRIYTGGDTAPTEPNIIIPYTLESESSLYSVVRLGDFNRDGYDDIGFSTDTMYLALNFNIIFGGDFITQYIATSVNYSESYTIGFNGIGDINGDGYDDFTIGYTNEDPNTGYHLITIYYGNEECLLTNAQILIQTQSAITKISLPLGDINGDGIDDFMGYDSSAGLNVWLGSPITSTIPNLYFNPAWEGSEFGLSLKHGDLNNDGFEDVAGANFYINQFRIWMGRTHPNGDSDLLITAPYIPENPLDYFGYGMTMGDYNGDDCCDIAVSAPFTDDPMANDYRGYVYIYAGNTELADTTTGINDPTTPSVSSHLNLSIYPNPVSINDGFVMIKVNDSNYDDKTPIDINLYNIRGQCVQKKHFDEITEINTYTMDISKMASGIYLCQVKQNNKMETKKISIIK